MDQVDVDLVAKCVAATGEGVANISAHVSMLWREATKIVWPRGWRSGASRATESIAALRWALERGYPWRGYTVLRAAARLGAIDVLRAVAPLYREWDAGATVAAATADQLEVILEFDPAPRACMLYAAGPRVRAHFADLVPLSALGAPSPWYEPERDFRRLLDGAVPIEKLTRPREWNNLQTDEWRQVLLELGPEHPTVLVRVRQSFPWRPPTNINGQQMFAVELPHRWANDELNTPTWSIVSDVRPTVGTIRFCDLGGASARNVFEPGRALFCGALQFHVITLWIEAPIDTPNVGIEFTGAIVSPAALLPYEEFATDERICYVNGMVGQVYRFGESRLERVDGSDNDAALVLG